MSSDTRGVRQHTVLPRSRARRRQRCRPRRETSQTPGGIVVRRSVAPDSCVIEFEVIVLGWNAQLGQRQAEQSAVFVGRHQPGLAVEGEIDQRMAERRELPVEHADHRAARSHGTSRWRCGSRHGKALRSRFRARARTSQRDHRDRAPGCRRRRVGISPIAPTSA